MTQGHIVPAGTVVDGGGAITLDAHGRPMTMFAAGSGDVTLERLTIKGARVAHQPPHFRVWSSVIDAAGALTLRAMSIEGSENPVDAHGEAVVTDSAFLGNTGIALVIDGEARVEDSRFLGNQSALLVKKGSVRRVVFSQNTGGAILALHPDGRLRLIASRFESNSGPGAVRLSQRSGTGGGGVVEIRRCTFASNSSTTGGGAVSIFDSTSMAPTPAVLRALRALPPARFEIYYSKFVRNSAPTGGAILADLANSAGLLVQGGIFLENNALDSGGAIAWEAGSIAVANTLFRANRATARGAAILGTKPSSAPGSFANVLVAENVAGPQGGAVELGGGLLRNVTIAANDAAGLVVGAGSASTSVGNSIFVDNRGGNCVGVSRASVAAGNVQHRDSSCPGVTVSDPYLDSLYVPQFGSPALSMGDPSACRDAPVGAQDIVFQPRGMHRCASGAFERPPVRRGTVRTDR